MKKRGKKQKGQIWVETVVYTLIALTLIGVVLAIVKPKIEESQDKAIIEQSVDIIKNVDSIVRDIKRAPGNQRIVELGIKKGVLKVDGVNDRIVFEIESRYEYSEPSKPGEPEKYITDEVVGITISTVDLGKFNNVTLTKDYSDEYNLKYSRGDVERSITKAANPYRLLISNMGEDINNKTIIDIGLA
jgi:type II secretory pathway pseudopilin PulG